MKILVCRIAAVGDCVQITPLIRYLKEHGHKVYVMTSGQGMQILKHNPNIHKLIYYEAETVPIEQLDDYFRKIQAQYKCDELINLNGSIEVKYLLVPADPIYNYSKQERFERLNKSHYDAVFEAAGLDVTGGKPEMFFSQAEEEANAKFRERFLGKFVVVWALSGSSMHKVYPYTRTVMESLIEKYPDIIFITVGDEFCQILETALEHERCIHKSGVWSLRETAIMCKYASLVVAPETGVLHFAGCFSTPKIGMLTHTTKECLTKYFDNDYSLEAEVDCSPCFRIITEAKVQCPIDKFTAAPWCAAHGFPPERLINRIEEVYELSHM